MCFNHHLKTSLHILYLVVSYQSNYTQNKYDDVSPTVPSCADPLICVYKHKHVRIDLVKYCTYVLKTTQQCGCLIGFNLPVLYHLNAHTEECGPIDKNWNLLVTLAPKFSHPRPSFLVTLALLKSHFLVTLAPGEGNLHKMAAAETSGKYGKFIFWCK